MRILIVYNSALDARSVSGVQTYFSGVVRHWIEAGAEVDVFVARAAWPIFQELFPKSELVSSDNLFDPTRHLGQTWRYLPAFGWRMFSHRFTKFPRAYDLIFACAQFIYEIGPARCLATRFNAALVVKVHHVLSAQRMAIGLFDRMHLLSEQISTRWLNREADAILCGTELIARDFKALEQQLGLKPRVTHPTGYGLDLEALPLSVDTLKDFDAVLLGRIHEHKGVFDAVEVWRKVCALYPTARLLIIGEGPHRVGLETRFAEAALSKSVCFTGAVGEREKSDLLARCRVGLSLSREEGWGLSVNEFLGVGLPVVAMEVPVFRAVFPRQLDLLTQGDIPGVAERILFWLNAPEAARQRGIDGRNFVRRYDHRAVAVREMSLLEEALRHRRVR